MSFEKIERVDQSLSPKPVAAPKTLEDHSGARIPKDQDQDGFVSADEPRLKNSVKDHAVGGADLDGDSTVTLREAVLASEDPLNPNNDLGEAQKSLEAVLKTMAGFQSSSAGEYVRYLSNLMNTPGVSRANVDGLLDEGENKSDLSVLA
jgi:hypothetical protein